MHDLIAKITEKTGISQEQATHAVHAVLGHIKDKLPAGLGSHLDGLLGMTDGAQGAAGGTPAAGGGGEDLLKKVGEMFGAK